MGPLPRTSVVAWTAIVAVVAFGFYFRFTGNGPLPIDTWWQDLVTVQRGTVPYAIAVFCAEVGAALGVAALGAAAMGLFFAMRRSRDAAALATALLLGVTISELLKAIVFRPRPSDPLYPTYGSSYPSGHSMGAAALAVSLALAFSTLNRVSARNARNARLIAMLATAWVLLMMWSRTALHAHWLSDTLGGALLGAASAVLAAQLWSRSGGVPSSLESVPGGK